ncbi:hypothetical protein C2869_06845 [Saccharobesus litoralis]|uniref:Uncharacterized protein n=2 Tax=Saccharobesus litoralis TaxID=2172099 RepID=A0A2S0VQ09_9ALTE|nr:hypothetical protein C2869_06845 [Saccharobesus litoralis]
MGLFNMLYFYKNYMKLGLYKDKWEPMLLVKSILYPLFLYKLIKASLLRVGGAFIIVRAVLLSFLLFFFVFSGVFGKLVGLLAFFTFFPLLLINMCFQKANSAIGIKEFDNKFSKIEILMSLVGTSLMAKEVLGLLNL